MGFKTVSAILGGRWMLEPNWANSHLPMVVMLLNGNPVSFIERTGNEQGERPFCIDPSTMNRYELFYNGQPNPNIPPNSVGILPISGPITKYNGECGEPGGIALASTLSSMLKRDNIGSIIQLIDTPGGEVGAENAYIAVAEKSKKPILSYVNGMCASLGMKFACASSEIYLSNALDSMGSIGTYCSLVDYSGFLKKNGFKVHEIYAPQSTDKNKNYKDALAGDYSGIQEDLKICTDAFIAYVAQSRNSKAASSADQWNSGKMFLAADAVKIGLADGIKPIDQVVSKAAWLSKRNKF